MKKESFIDKIKSKLKFVLLAILLIFAIIGIKNIIPKKEEIDVVFITNQLQKSSDLTSAQVKMTGVYNYVDDGIVVINRQNFIMVYEATVNAGIDLKQAKVKLNKVTKKVVVEIPKANILSVDVDTENIKYYNEAFTLFNFNKKEDANKATALAKKEAAIKAQDIGVIELADSHAEAIIMGIIEPLIPDNYKVEIVKK